MIDLVIILSKYHTDFSISFIIEYEHASFILMGQSDRSLFTPK